MIYKALHLITLVWIALMLTLIADSMRSTQPIGMNAALQALRDIPDKLDGISDQIAGLREAPRR